MSILKEVISKSLLVKKESVPNFYKMYNDVNNYNAVPSAKKKDNILLFVENKEKGVQLLINKKDLPVSFCSKVFNYPSKIQYVLFPKTFEEIVKEIKNIKIEKNKEYIIKLVNNFDDFPKELNIEITIDKNLEFAISGLFDINKGFMLGKEEFLSKFSSKVYIKMIDEINKRLLENKEINFILDNFK